MYTQPVNVDIPFNLFHGEAGVQPETAGAKLIDYRISCYQLMGCVALHTHTVQEQVYRVLEGKEGWQWTASVRWCESTLSSISLPAWRTLYATTG